MGYYSFDLRSHSFSCSFLKYCISRDVMQSNFYFPRGQVLVFIKDSILSYQGLRFSNLTKGRYDETFAGEDEKTDDNKYSQKLAFPSPSD